MPARSAERRADDERRAEARTIGRGPTLAIALALAVLLWLTVRLEQARHVAEDAETVRATSAGATR
ncbi:MAG: hypothetical protein ACXW61_18560 [Gemmatirosa sp.]